MKFYLVSNVPHHIRYYDRNTGVLIPKAPNEKDIYSTLLPATRSFRLFTTLKEAEAHACSKQRKKKWPNGTESLEEAFAVAEIEVDTAHLTKREDGNYEAKKQDVVFAWSASIQGEFKKYTYNFLPKLEKYLSIFRQATGDFPSALAGIFAQYEKGWKGFRYFRQYLKESEKIRQAVSNVADGKTELTYSEVIRNEIDKHKTGKSKLPGDYCQCLAAAWLGSTGSVVREEKGPNLELITVISVPEDGRQELKSSIVCG